MEETLSERKSSSIKRACLITRFMRCNSTIFSNTVSTMVEYLFYKKSISLVRYFSWVSAFSLADEMGSGLLAVEKTLYAPHKSGY